MSKKMFHEEFKSEDEFEAYKEANPDKTLPSSTTRRALGREGEESMSKPGPSVYVIVEESRELTPEQWDIIKKLLRGWEMRGLAEFIQTEHQPTHWLEYARAKAEPVTKEARDRSALGENAKVDFDEAADSKRTQAK